MNLNDIPQDSILRNWLLYMRSTEVPFSYAVAVGLAVIGAVLKRNRWIDQFDWHVYPNQSVMLIGPSGVGKDTAINRALRTVEHVQAFSHVPIIGGVTLEAIQFQMARLAEPAACIIPAPEMTAFFGKADYQQNMLTGITNLLSTGERVDISTKGGLKGGDFSPGTKTVILKPTPTMLAGSTVEWLHKSMPDGTLEGGFLGRFLIVVEELGARHIPLVKADRTKGELETLKQQLATWNQGVMDAVLACNQPREVILYGEAEAAYSNWYHNRFKQFSKAVAPYANRSRDTVLRLALLMALSRGHYRWIEEEDVVFATTLIKAVADKIDSVALPPTPEAAIARKVMEMLPAAEFDIYGALSERYKRFFIEEALKLLRSSRKIVTGKDGRIYPIEGGEETN